MDNGTCCRFPEWGGEVVRTFFLPSLNLFYDYTTGDSFEHRFDHLPKPEESSWQRTPLTLGIGGKPDPESMELSLLENDPRCGYCYVALHFEPEVSAALGFGFRCGFLGLLHMEIIQERLEREYNLDLITTAPGVTYKVHKTDGKTETVTNPCNLPPQTEIAFIEEPMVAAEIYTPPEYIGSIMELCQDKRGIFEDMQYLDAKRVRMKYRMPLSEIVYDFFDGLKSRSRGYASLDYELAGYEKSDMVKLDILLNGEICDALSLIIHREKAQARGRALAEKLKQVIPRQLFEIPIQAAIGGKIIARETVKAMRKDVLAKCYGGDVTRKKKLLEKQKEGKKRMRQFGSVEIPSEAFTSILKLDNE